MLGPCRLPRPPVSERRTPPSAARGGAGLRTRDWKGGRSTQFGPGLAGGGSGGGELPCSPSARAWDGLAGHPSGFSSQDSGREAQPRCRVQACPWAPARAPSPPLGRPLRPRAGSGRAEPESEQQGLLLAHSLPRPAALRPARLDPPPPSDNGPPAPAAVNFLPLLGRPCVPDGAPARRRPGSQLRGSSGGPSARDVPAPQPPRLCSGPTRGLGALLADSASPGPLGCCLAVGFRIWLPKEDVILLFCCFLFPFIIWRGEKNSVEQARDSEVPPATPTRTSPGERELEANLVQLALRSQLRLNS